MILSALPKIRVPLSQLFRYYVFTIKLLSFNQHNIMILSALPKIRVPLSQLFRYYVFTRKTKILDKSTFKFFIKPFLKTFLKTKNNENHIWCTCFSFFCCFGLPLIPTVSNNIQVCFCNVCTNSCC